MHPPAPSLVVSTAGLMALTLLSTGCSRVPSIRENDVQANQQARSAPLVVVGLMDSDHMIGVPQPSRRDPSYPMMLHKTRIHIENVLRGSISDSSVTVYYFGFAGGFNGPRPLGLWEIPTRRVFWLREDAGVLRVACDGRDCTAPVESGAHPHYQADPNKSLDYALADILLTRGEGPINDIGFASEITWGVPDQGLQGHVIDMLEHLASTESGDIKASACEQLWVYTQDQIGDVLNQRAANSLAAARCKCTPKPGGAIATCE